MLLIPCPHCGERDESEFDYGGRVLVMPGLEAAQEDWHRALHLGDERDEIVDEYWHHAAGCECWIRLRRNLSNHEFVDAVNTASGVND